MSALASYEICCQADGLPAMLSEYQQRAALAEEFGVSDEDGASVCFVSVGRPHQWPFLVVIQRYAPAGCGCRRGPGCSSFAGRQLLAYNLSRPARLWEDEAECGFWSWARHGQVVLMAAELELAAWDQSGRNADPAAEWLPAEIARDAKGFVLTGTDVIASGLWPRSDREPCPLETSVPGVLAAGDIRAGSVKRVGFAVGDGSWR